MSVPTLQQPTRVPARVWTVSELTGQIKELLETEFALVWLAGEISNFKRHSSGHLYLTLKDDRAQIPAVIWRTAASRVVFELSDGLEVIVQGRLGVYEPLGKYQIIIEQVQPKGLGALELKFRQLREKLEKEGLFARERKRPLPRFPRRIVVVTSPTGAAVRDMLQVICRRWPCVDIWIRPVRVQGDGAAQEIAAAIAEVNRLGDVDVMIVGRGGGSLEDLWAFNEEVVARAIFAARIPIVSAVGHEVDLTIADLVADRRALTPSEAGELVVPNQAEIRELLAGYGRRMPQSLLNRLQAVRARWQQLAGRRPFRFPHDGVRFRQQRCDELSGRLRRAMENRLSDARHRVARSGAMLDGLSPLKVLARGYSLTTREDGVAVVRDAADVAVGERLVTRLARGRVTSHVERTDADP
jgi:exodeoxyribonuclease VII large subunit